MDNINDSDKFVTENALKQLVAMLHEDRQQYNNSIAAKQEIIIAMIADSERRITDMVRDVSGQIQQVETELRADTRKMQTKIDGFATKSMIIFSVIAICVIIILSGVIIRENTDGFNGFSLPVKITGATIP